MAKGTQHIKPKVKKVAPTHGVGPYMKGALFLVHTVLCILFMGHYDLTYVGIMIGLGLLISAIYWMWYRKDMFTNRLVENGIRYVLSYVLMTMTAFFYALAMYRSGELTETMHLIIAGLSYVVWLCLYSATQGLIKKES